MIEDTTGKSIGGHARSDALTPEQRTEIAKKAAEKRWDVKVLKATHAGDLKIGEVNLPCSVLADGSRVLSMRGINTAFTGNRGGGLPEKDGAHNLPRFLASNAVKPFISDDLMARLNTPIEYKPLHGGRTAYGYDASLLPDICEVIIDAERSGELNKPGYAATAEILLRGFARVGIVALVDEATGYQTDRAKDALSQILEAFISKELQPWLPTFPASFYEELFRLRGLPFPSGTVKRPQYFGSITNNIVYDRLAPGIREELQKVVPRNDSGRPTAKYFQKLTQNMGYQKLKEHLGAVVAVMRMSKDWKTFMHNMDTFYPKYGETILMQMDYKQEKDDGKGL